jgi:SagB-type dehydrogenase family enzyme
MSVEHALASRRSTREYKDGPLTLAEVSQLLWAAQGISDQAEAHRTAPSAGATYPLEVSIACGNVDGVAAGAYQYDLRRHELVKIREGDVRGDLAAAALDQAFIRTAAVALVWSAVYERTTQRYGERGTRYVHMEVGHSGQNVHLQAAALGLGTVVVGAFDDGRVRDIMRIPSNAHPLYIMPVGRI